MTSPIKLLKTAGVILLCFMMLMVTALLLSGCQPTPEKEIVVGKGEEQIQQMISAAENDDIPNETEVYEPIPINYQAPTEIVECISTNVELLPFEEIEEKFKDYIRYNGCNTGKIYMDISRIELSLMAIPQPDSEEYLIVPVWDFYGGAVLSSDTTYIPDEEYWNGQIFYHYGRSFLTINAANGSIINRLEGY